jgi:serine/threonine-protein phosphatase 5
MPTPQEEALELKNKGNEAFRKQDWPTAVSFYTKAIEVYDKEPSFYTNRAQVCLDARSALVESAD